MVMLHSVVAALAFSVVGTHFDRQASKLVVEAEVVPVGSRQCLLLIHLLNLDSNSNVDGVAELNAPV